VTTDCTTSLAAYGIMRGVVVFGCAAASLGDVAIGPVAAKSAEERVASAPLIGETGWRAVQAARMAAARKSAQKSAGADPSGLVQQHITGKEQQQPGQKKEDMDGEDEQQFDIAFVLGCGQRLAESDGDGGAGAHTAAQARPHCVWVQSMPAGLRRQLPPIQCTGEHADADDQGGWSTPPATVQHDACLRWSPDGAWLVWASAATGSGQLDLVLWDRATDTTQLLAAGAWLPCAQDRQRCCRCNA
jgi:hypothetical protein